MISKYIYAYYLYGYLSPLQHLFVWLLGTFSVSLRVHVCPVGGSTVPGTLNQLRILHTKKKKCLRLRRVRDLGKWIFFERSCFLLENSTLTCHRHTPDNNYRRFRQLCALMFGYKTFFWFSSCKFIINEAFVLKVSGRGCQSTQVFKTRAGRFSQSKVFTKHYR